MALNTPDLIINHEIDQFNKSRFNSTSKVKTKMLTQQLKL